jgi:hypothetical protein
MEARRLMSQATQPSLNRRISASATEWPWWRTTRHDWIILPWMILIHTTALVGLILFPLPGWHVVLGAATIAWLGGISTTV